MLPEDNRHQGGLGSSGVRVLVVNRADSASINIRDRLLETGDWVDTGSTFRGHPMHQRGYDVLVEVDGPTIHDEALSDDLLNLEWPIHAVWFLSRHAAASGQPSFTVHPIGNPGDAPYGGQPGTFSPAAARDMGALLRRLQHHRDAAELDHQVSYEATHHGPYMALPSLFVEIGSDDRWYEVPQMGEVLAAAVTDVLDGEGYIDGPIQVGVGGGHYVPRMNDKALAGEADFGHMLAAYAIDADGDGSVVAEAWAKTPGAEVVYVHKKGLKGPQRQAVAAWCDAANLPMDGVPRPTS